MRHISAADQAIIVAIIRNWEGRRLTWEAIRIAVAAKCTPRGEPWTRQALSSNEAISAAYRTGIQRLSASRGSDGKPKEVDSSTKKIQTLEADLQELRDRYERLVNRHRQLLFNASLLPGGVQLLAEPLPDNTRSQGGAQAAGRPPRKKPARKPRKA